MSSMTKKRADQAAGGVFLIGIGVLFLIGDFWPGVLLIIAAAMIARSVTLDGHWAGDRRAFVFLVLWVLFALPGKGMLLLSLAFIFFGVLLLFNQGARRAAS